MTRPVPMRFSRRFRLALPLTAVVMALTGCVGVPPAPSDDLSLTYTIARQRPNVVSTGRPFRNLVAGANLNPGEVAGVIEANPGLREALVRNGYDLRRITGLRVSPTRVVDVYYEG